jgi:hypothetical protein
MDVAGFTDPWYAKKIGQSMEGWDNASVDSRVVAHAILVGFAMIAQSIDNSFGHTASECDNNALSALESIAAEMVTIADRFNR